MKFVLIYQNGDLSKAAEHFPAHRERWTEFHARGLLLMVGPFVPPSELGAMGVFTTREAAVEFVAGDPFVLHGVVSSSTILEWREVLAP